MLSCSLLLQHPDTVSQSSVFQIEAERRCHLDRYSTGQQKDRKSTNSRFHIHRCGKRRCDSRLDWYHSMAVLQSARPLKPPLFGWTDARFGGFLVLHGLCNWEVREPVKSFVVRRQKDRRSHSSCLECFFSLEHLRSCSRVHSLFRHGCSILLRCPDFQSECWNQYNIPRHFQAGLFASCGPW